MKIRHLYLSVALPVLGLSLSQHSFAQVEITDARTQGVSTSAAGANSSAADVKITTTGSITITTGAGITLDSDNNVENEGAISSKDANDTTGILVSGSRTGNVTNKGTIRLDETTPTDNLTAGGDIATGSNRVGILISGASPFTGNITNDTGGSISIIGQDSSGIRLANLSSMAGDITHNGTISVFGERSVGMDILGNVIGNLAVNGAISATGENVNAIKVAGDVTGGLKVTSSLNATGYVSANRQAISTRPNLATRTAVLGTGSIKQAGSVVVINGNISQGIHLAEQRNDAGALISTSRIAMIGSAPAILIDGNGTPIAIGRVGQITDVNDENFDADLQFAFVNQGNLTAQGVFDDINATTFSLKDATLEGGINNTNVMQATVFRSGVDPAATAPTPNAHARVIVIGGGGIAERINNTGVIVAQGLEATDSIYADPDNVLAPNQVFATAIDIDANGSLSSITNLRTISAVITARNGEAIAIRDASGTLVEINNSGLLQALGNTSDPDGKQATNFNLIAIDVSANTSGFTLDQTVFDDPDTTTDIVPAITGDILLGSGDDVINVAGGTITGDISFGDGADRLAISNGAVVSGGITDTDGKLDIIVTDKGHLDITTADNINVTTATIDATSIYSPFINPDTGEVSTLIATDAVTFEDGAVIAPRLSTVLNSSSASFTIAQAGTLNIDTAINGLRSDETPFLYNTVFARSATDANTLIMTLDVRSTSELGLDAQQAALFTSAFEALQSSTALGGAFVGITDQTTFNSSYNQLLPEFAAASRQFVLANVDGVTGAVGSHLSNARRSQDRPGGAWIEEFVYYADRELAGLSDQFRGYGFGITGGFDIEVGPFHTVGINAGFATTEIEDVIGTDDPLDILTLQLGAYAGYQTGNLGIDIYAGAGYNDYEAKRKVTVGSFEQTAQGDWSGVHYNGSLSAGYDVSFGKYYVRPAVTATYLSLSEKAYTEEGTTGIELAIDKRTVNTATASATIDFGARFERERSWMAPALRVGFRNDFVNEGVVTTGRFVNGTTPFSLQAEEFPNSGFLLGITFATGSGYSSFSFDYDADIRDGFSRHTARFVLRLLF